MKTIVPVVFLTLFMIACDQILLQPPEDTSLDLTTALAPAADAPVASSQAAGETVSGFTIGGTAIGGFGPSLVLQNNGGDDLSVNAAGSFTFATRLQDGAAYTVTVFNEPSGYDCSGGVVNGTGAVAGANVTNLSVTCNPS